MAEFAFDGRDMAHMGADLRRAAASVVVETERTLVEVGKLLEKGVRAKAGKYSTTIPPTVRTKSGPNLIEVLGGNEKVVIGELFEMGNKGAKRSAKTFRHPVFGQKDVWVEQPMHRYLSEARREARPAIALLMNKTWDRALSPYRLG